MFSPAQAAVSLTYDDGIAEHLDHAVPDLESHGLRGTFYVPTAGGEKSTWHARPAEWMAIAAKGHEIGNHTRVHPCRGFSPQSVNLENYTFDEITSELALAEAELTARLGPGLRSFAYPCSHTTVGPQSNQISYAEFTNTLFPASRIGKDELADPASIDFLRVPSFMMHEKFHLVDVLCLIDQAIASQRWIVLMFHGVGGGHINFGREEHQAICKYVADRSNDLLCRPLVEIANHIRLATHRPWTP